jgi:ubiquinone/menaquinone biosynthesis C-methylase UbiE
MSTSTPRFSQSVQRKYHLGRLFRLKTNQAVATACRRETYEGGHVSFEVAADAYDNFMGRYSVQLAAQLADLAGVEAGQRAIDVGSGPGALTTELVRRLGADAVAAVDPSEPFVEAARERHPGVDVRLAPAEQLPFEDGSFDAALAQLVVSFMSDPVAGLAEMARVTRSGGVVAACVWDLAGGRAPISPFWQAARDLDSATRDESALAGAREHHLAELFAEAGLRDVEEAELSSTVEHETFEDWWRPYTLGVGPAGAHAKSLGDDELTALRKRCRELLPEPPFTFTAYAWAARGLA